MTRRGEGGESREDRDARVLETLRELHETGYYRRLSVRAAQPAEGELNRPDPKTIVTIRHVTRQEHPPVTLTVNRRSDSDRIVGRTVESMTDSTALNGIYDEIRWDQLDRAQLPGWIKRLREAEQHTRALRSRLQALQDGGERPCRSCGQPVSGRTDRVFCGATCRQRHRRSQLQP